MDSCSTSLAGSISVGTLNGKPTFTSTPGLISVRITATGLVDDVSDDILTENSRPSASMSFWYSAT